MRFTNSSVLLTIASLIMIASIYHVQQTSLKRFSPFNIEIINKERRLLNIDGVETLRTLDSLGLFKDLDGKKKKFCDDRGLRFKVLGSDQSIPSTYPYSLCNADNSLRADSTPEEWAVCFRSRIDESVHDVFVLDYYDVADENLVKLGKRIRNRFPDALIINLKHWYPIHIGYPGTNGWTNVAEWAKTFGYDNMTNAALMAFQDSTLPWERRDIPTQESYFTSTTQRTSAWTIFKGSESEADLPAGKEFQDMLNRRSWMYTDWHIRNDKGDYDVARGIYDLLEKLDTTKGDTVKDWVGNDDPSSCFM